MVIETIDPVHTKIPRSLDVSAFPLDVFPLILGIERLGRHFVRRTHDLSHDSTWRVAKPKMPLNNPISYPPSRLSPGITYILSLSGTIVTFGPYRVIY